MNRTVKRKRLLRALSEVGEAIRGGQVARPESEMNALLDSAETAARAMGPLAATVSDALLEAGFATDSFLYLYRELVDRGHLSVARRIASVFAVIAPDEGRVECARLSVLSGSREAVAEVLEPAALDRSRALWSRMVALDYLFQLAPESFARVAPEALRAALSSGDRNEAYEIAETLREILFEPEPDPAPFEKVSWLHSLRGNDELPN